MLECPELQQVSIRRRWRESDARVVVEAWRESGETLAAFCREYDLKPPRVARWASRLNVAASVRFHPVRVLERPGAVNPRWLTVELPTGETVRLAPGFELDDLQRVLQALRHSRAC
jgi:hypothetical protein